MSAGAASSRFRDGWILSPRADLAMFAGPILLSAGLLFMAHRGGFLHRPVAPWAFALLIVGCDVAHVWSTLFRTYLDPEERARRPGLYVGVPLACFLVGVLLYSVGDMVFWRVLAYVAAYHFVRQQYGWLVYAARKAGETDPLDRRLDAAAIYNAKLFPLLWWHAYLPRAFDWFREGDFVAGLPEEVGAVGMVLHWSINAVWLGRQGWLFVTGRGFNRAKFLVLATTWCAWYGGIVWLNSDLAFTATNVLLHGVPYLFLVHRWGSRRWAGSERRIASFFKPAGVVLFYGLVLSLGFVEEAVWDRLVWGEHGGLFPGPYVRLGSSALMVVVPLLTVPQATHYFLDAFLWKTGKDNPGLKEHLGFSG